MVRGRSRQHDDVHRKERQDHCNAYYPVRLERNPRRHTEERHGAGRGLQLRSAGADSCVAAPNQSVVNRDTSPIGVQREIPPRREPSWVGYFANTRTSRSNENISLQQNTINARATRSASATSASRLPKGHTFRESRSRSNADKRPAVRDDG